MRRSLLWGAFGVPVVLLALRRLSVAGGGGLPLEASAPPDAAAPVTAGQVVSQAAPEPLTTGSVHGQDVDGQDVDGQAAPPSSTAATEPDVLPLGGPLAGVAAWWREVRVGMAEREVELRAAVGLDGTHDQVDAHTLGPAAAARRPVVPGAATAPVGGA